MKISKRILGAALALIMIFNVFAVGTFAASFPDVANIKLVVKTDKAVYAPGEEVTITVALQVTSAVSSGKVQGNGAYSLAYSSAGLQPITTSENFFDNGGVDILGGLATNSAFYIYDDPSYIYEADAQTYGWDRVAAPNLVGDSPVGADAVDAPVDVWSYKMLAGVDGTYTIGFNACDYEASMAYISCPEGDQYWDGSAVEYEYGTATFTVGTAVAAKPVAHKAFQVKATDVGNTDAATLGFKGSIDSTDASIILDKVSTESNKLVDITAVGCKIELNDGSSTVIADATTDTIYKVGDTSEYDFRAVVENFDLTAYGAAEIKVTYYVVSTTNGTIESDVEITTANAIMASK